MGSIQPFDKERKFRPEGQDGNSPEGLTGQGPKVKKDCPGEACPVGKQAETEGWSVGQVIAACPGHIHPFPEVFVERFRRSFSNVPNLIEQDKALKAWLKANKGHSLVPAVMDCLIMPLLKALPLGKALTAQDIQAGLEAVRQAYPLHLVSASNRNNPYLSAYHKPDLPVGQPVEGWAEGASRAERDKASPAPRSAVRVDDEGFAYSDQQGIVLPADCFDRTRADWWGQQKATLKARAEAYSNNPALSYEDLMKVQVSDAEWAEVRRSAEGQMKQALKVLADEGIGFQDITSRPVGNARSPEGQNKPADSNKDNQGQGQGWASNAEPLEEDRADKDSSCPCPDCEGQDKQDRSADSNKDKGNADRSADKPDKPDKPDGPVPAPKQQNRADSPADGPVGQEQPVEGLTGQSDSKGRADDEGLSEPDKAGLPGQADAEGLEGQSEGLSDKNGPEGLPDAEGQGQNKDLPDAEGQGQDEWYVAPDRHYDPVRTADTVPEGLLETRPGMKGNYPLPYQALKQHCLIDGFWLKQQPYIQGTDNRADFVYPAIPELGLPEVVHYREISQGRLKKKILWQPAGLSKQYPDVEGIYKRLWTANKITASKTVFVVEGETTGLVVQRMIEGYRFHQLQVKDLPADERLSAVCVALAGATMFPPKGQWQHLLALTGADRIVVVPDNDEAGQQCADRLVADLKGLKVEVFVGRLPDRQGKVKDCKDWYVRWLKRQNRMLAPDRWLLPYKAWPDFVADLKFSKPELPEPDKPDNADNADNADNDDADDAVAVGQVAVDAVVEQANRAGKAGRAVRADSKAGGQMPEGRGWSGNNIANRAYDPVPINLKHPEVDWKEALRVAFNFHIHKGFVRPGKGSKGMFHCAFPNDHTNGDRTASMKIDLVTYQVICHGGSCRWGAVSAGYNPGGNTLRLYETLIYGTYNDKDNLLKSAAELLGIQLPDRKGQG